MSTPASRTFAKRLRETRQALELTQLELAERCNIQAGEINHYEAGRRLPGFENLRAIIGATGGDPSWLLVLK